MSLIFGVEKWHIIAHIILWQESLVGENSVLHVYCRAKLYIQYTEVKSNSSAHVLIKHDFT